MFFWLQKIYEDSLFWDSFLLRWLKVTSFLFVFQPNTKIRWFMSLRVETYNICLGACWLEINFAFCLCFTVFVVLHWFSLLLNVAVNQFCVSSFSSFYIGFQCC